MNRKHHSFFKHTLFLLVFGVAASACAGLANLPGGFGGGGSSRASSHHTETSSESHSESLKVNGEEVATNDDDDDAPRTSKQSKHGGGDDFGATCQHNSDCASNTCYVGYGELGYCTKMCDSWSDCPAHWDCEKAGNAPQRICQQDSD